MFANYPKKRRVGIGLNARGFAIDRKGNRRHEYLPFVWCSCEYGFVFLGPRLHQRARFLRPHIGRGAIRKRILEAVQDAQITAAAIGIAVRGPVLVAWARSQP